MGSIVQQQFRKFHTNIQLDWEDQLATLREKRERVLDKLRAGLERQTKEEGLPARSFESRNYGSYALGTGVRPIDGGKDYDIDVVLLFNCSIAEEPKPVKLKERVLAALAGHTDKVEIRRPCVTVWYHEGGEPAYHVDLAVLSVGSANPDGVDRIAKGFPGSAEENKVWEACDPLGLVTAIDGAREGDTKAQFRRVVRYLKRWKDQNFRASGEAGPRGIGLTCATHSRFVYTTRVCDPLTQVREDDDLGAILAVVQGMLNGFGLVWHEGEAARRLSAPLPVRPGDDPLLRMSNKQMATFEERLRRLRDTLQKAQGEARPEVACELLKGEFGADFPVPERSQTARAVVPPILSSNISA